MTPYRILYLDDEDRAYRQMKETIDEFWREEFLLAHWKHPVTRLQPRDLPPPELLTHEAFGGPGVPGLRKVASDLHDGDRALVLERIDVLVIDLDLGVRHSATDIRLSGAVLGEQVLRYSRSIQPILLSQHYNSTMPEGVPSGIEMKAYEVRGLGQAFPKREIIGKTQSEAHVGLFFMTLIKHAEQARDARSTCDKDGFQRRFVLTVEDLLPSFSRRDTGLWLVGGKPRKRKFVTHCSKLVVESSRVAIPESCYPAKHNPQQLLRILDQRRPDLAQRLREIDPGR